jgi:ribosomal protein S15P/S13E
MPNSKNFYIYFYRKLKSGEKMVRLINYLKKINFLKYQITINQN